MVDIKQGALSAFAEDLLAGFEGLVQIDGRVLDIGAQKVGGLKAFGGGLAWIKRGQAVLPQGWIGGLDGGNEPFGKGFDIEQDVAGANA